MKRWQTRGEVQDSDEEDLELEEDQQSLQHARKRLKVQLAQDTAEEGVHHEAFIQNEIASPGSGKFEKSPNTEPHVEEGTDRRMSKVSGNLVTQDGAGPLDIVEDENPHNSSPERSSQSHGAGRGLVPVITQVERQDVELKDQYGIYEIPSSGTLPEDPVAASKDAERTPRGLPLEVSTSETPRINGTTSATSSPLSELSDPPDSPPFLGLPESTHRIRPTISNGVSTAVNEETSVALDDHGIPTLLLTQGARRSLRARQEKQLHPYMYDRAQYQQQCRERGLRPVRLLEQMANETQNSATNPDLAHPSSSAACPTSSSSSEAFMSSGLPLDDSVDSLSTHQRMTNSGDELPDVDQLTMNRSAAGQLQSRKRRKLFHVSKGRDGRVEHAATALEAEDEYPVPPSPPPSTQGAQGNAKAPRSFRLPRGISPMPLPTPQISSDIRPTNGGNQGGVSDEDSPPRTSRRLARVRSMVTVGSDSSSESSRSEPEDEEKQLLRERRRIRGVLPASWLNIDRKAQPVQPQASVNHAGHQSPAPQPAPQRGVARKIQRRSGGVPDSGILEISDGGETSASDNTTPIARHQQRLASTEQPSHIAVPQDDDVDIDNMEADWFDPMFGGTSRARRAPKSKGKRQSRITDVLNRRPKLDFSEERNGLRQSHKERAPRRQVKTHSKSARTRKAPPKPPKLGIIDAPNASPNPGERAPHFVRLATRQARSRPNQGRHSPSQKFIRLATHGDTELANNTLENWRQGKIQKRVTTQPSLRPGDTGRAYRERDLETRTPLARGFNHPHGPTTPSIPSETAPTLDAHDTTPTRVSAITRNELKHRGNPARMPPRSGSHSSDSRTIKQANSTRPRRAIRPRASYREAQLETPESAYVQQNRSAAFQHRVQCLTEAVRRVSTTPAPHDIPLTRFLQESEGSSRTVPNERHDRSGQQHHDEPASAGSTLPVVSLARPPRKHQAQRIDIETRQYRQPSEPLPTGAAVSRSQDVIDDLQGPVLRGLGPAGMRYAVDFDIRHLPHGSYFHQSTFIGSGDLLAALKLDNRDLTRCRGSLRILINGTMHEWNEWSEDVGAAISEIPKAVSASLRASQDIDLSQREEQLATVTLNVDYLFRSTVRYLSSCLYFLDAIDQHACCSRLDQVVQDVLELATDDEHWTTELEGVRQQTRQYVLVLARQNHILSKGSLVPASVRAAIHGRLVTSASQLAAYLIPGKLDNLRSAYEEQRVASTRELGIRKDDSAIAGLTILHHCLKSIQSARSAFWEVVGNALGAERVDILNNSADLDNVWYSIYTLLPCLYFDASGVIQGATEGVPESEWSLPRRLVARCLELYPATSKIRGISCNEYVRATLSRCYRLFATWHWWKCDSLFGTLYDFFAVRGLNLLYKEEGQGSPEFLDNLPHVEDLALDVDQNDRSFSVFLKMLASALRTWRRHNVYPDKKIGSIAWRIIPNHARIYRKDAEVRQTDLDALRNHFDLLCTLYFASPPSYRLRVDLLRHLVDHSTSHREACRISVRAWSRLASFQASTNEPLATLKPFAEWFNDMVQVTVAQYRFARTDAEQQYADAKVQGVSDLSDDLLERTVASNQRQIAATIVDLLAAYGRVLRSASSHDVAQFLVETCEPWKALDTFDVSERRLSAVYMEALKLIKTTIEVQRRFQSTSSDANAQSEDSQDYGDFSILQEFATGQTASQTASQSNDNPRGSDLAALIHEPVAQLLSNAFGSEICPDDGLLTSMVESWVDLAHHLVVSKGLRSWSNYVDDYRAGAWFQLRDTVQHRKYTPFFLAKILEVDSDAFHSLRQTFLVAWLKSLVERESTLRFQHLLTAALLNMDFDEPILQNLPFSKNPSLARYKISLPELRQRRLGVLSSVLSNMLEHWNKMHADRPQALPALRRDYSELLRQLMQAMKSNYQDLQLGHPSDSADGSIQGAYVTFVQEVVSFLQQYTNKRICDTDPFFLDSSAFPLPAADPEYVVGKLRSYNPKLAETGTRTALTSFLHNVSERAAGDNQQTYLASQFHTAMSGTPELGNAETPSLRHVILTSIFPAYIQAAFDSAFTWVLALPMLEASAKTVADSLYDVVFEDEHSIAAAVEQVSTLLSAVQKAIGQLLTQGDSLTAPHALKTTTAMLELCRAAVPFSNHVQRLTGKASRVMDQLKALQRQSAALDDRLSVEEDDFFDPTIVDIEDDAAEAVLAPKWPETYKFSLEQVRGMPSKWSEVDGRIFVRRGNGSKEVIARVGGFEEEREGLAQAIRGFQRSCAGRRGRGQRGAG